MRKNTNPLSDELQAQWHPTKNLPALPEQVSAGSSSFKAWWICDKGHEYDAKPLHRTNGSNCPYCAGTKPIVGENDLGTTHPKLVNKHWHPTKNLPLLPSHIKASSGKSVIWVCDKGHESVSSPSSKISHNVNCKYCSNVALLTGYNDLATRNPEIAKQWHPTKNEDLTPSDVLFGSSKKVWWLCDKGHEWERGIGGRTRGSGCPFCSGNEVWLGFNDLATVNPTLAKEWHPTKNSKTPQEYTGASGATVWWLCDKGHEWQAQISNRKNGAGCNTCGIVRQGIVHSTPKLHKDLLFNYPDIAKQWHPTKNGLLLPEQCRWGSARKVWWLCDKGHEWSVGISDRTTYQTGCPICATKTFVSKPEIEIFDFLTSLGLTVIQSDRKILKGSELDLYIPEKKFAIEFNGLYWHREQEKRDNNRHYLKWLASKEAGIQLVQIWEDDWTARKSIILRALAHKLGLSAKLEEVFPELADHVKRVGGNKTSIVNLDTGAAQTFLAINHVQGFASGSHYVGLKDSNNLLRAVIVLRKEKDEVLNIVRYATSGSVIGGFTKLLKYAERTYSPKSFITFADHTISDGGLYQNNGFVVDKEIPPDYMYIVKGQRKHKFGYRLKRFKSDPELIWEDGLTERELALLNKIPRVWDAGKTRYRLILSE